MDKEYEFEALLGIKSDTHDILGLTEFVNNVEINENVVSEELFKFVGKRKQKYPIFSSKTINGKPLFEIARASLGSSASKLIDIEGLLKRI